MSTTTEELQPWNQAYERLSRYLETFALGDHVEVSRLARSNADWYRLLDMCAITDTLLADSDGVYHPALFNDRLILGLNRPDTQSTSYSISFEVDDSSVSFDIDPQRGLVLASPSRRQIYPTC